jgi:hypothetical protein
MSLNMDLIVWRGKAKPCSQFEVGPISSFRADCRRYFTDVIWLTLLPGWRSPDRKRECFRLFRKCYSLSLPSTFLRSWICKRHFTVKYLLAVTDLQRRIISHFFSPTLNAPRHGNGRNLEWYEQVFPRKHP